MAPTSTGDYHLHQVSPVVDLGTGTGAPGDDFDRDIRPIGPGIDMGADEVKPVLNQAPLLTWTMESGYAADGVSPDSGPNGGSYVFRVNYSDLDDDAPSVVEVWIDSNDDGDYLDAGEKVTSTKTKIGDYLKNEMSPPSSESKPIGKSPPTL